MTTKRELEEALVIARLAGKEVRLNLYDEDMFGRMSRYKVKSITEGNYVLAARPGLDVRRIWIGDIERYAVV